MPSQAFARLLPRPAVVVRAGVEAALLLDSRLHLLAERLDHLLDLVARLAGDRLHVLLRVLLALGAHGPFGPALLEVLARLHAGERLLDALALRDLELHRGLELGDRLRRRLGLDARLDRTGLSVRGFLLALDRLVRFLLERIGPAGVGGRGGECDPEEQDRCERCGLARHGTPPLGTLRDARVYLSRFASASTRRSSR